MSVLTDEMSTGLLNAPPEPVNVKLVPSKLTSLIKSFVSVTVSVAVVIPVICPKPSSNIS